MSDAWTMVEGKINDRWPLALTSDRCEFHKARPLWEAGRLAHMADHVEPGDTIYDVGAECGDFTGLYATWVGGAGTVVPFEPKPEMWPSIRLHWDANTLGVPAAWWPGFASAYTGRNESELTAIGWPADAWPTWADAWPPVLEPGFRHLVDGNGPQTRLDDFAEATGVAPDVIVMDIEGAEYDALVGCERLLREHQPSVYVSVHDIGDESWPGALKGWYGRTLDDLHALMDGHGYTAVELEHHGEAEHFWAYLP